MKKSYTKEKRTTVALNPDMTSRIEKVLGKKGMSRIYLSKFVIPVINEALEVEEQKQLFQELNNLKDSKQYYKIKKLEERIEEIPELKQRLARIEDQVKYFKEEYEEEEKIADDPEAFAVKARKEFQESEPETSAAYDKAEAIHKKFMDRNWDNETPKERKEREADLKRIGKKLRKERKERRKKLFKN